MSKDIEPVSSTGSAEYIRHLTDWRGDARLYRIDPPIEWFNWQTDETSTTDYVIVSGISNEFGIETYIFPADSDGEALNMTELEGSFKGAVDHAAALANAGYGAVFE